MEVQEVARLAWVDIFHADEERGLIREMDLDSTTKWLAVIRDSVSFIGCLSQIRYWTTKGRLGKVRLWGKLISILSATERLMLWLNAYVSYGR